MAALADPGTAAVAVAATVALGAAVERITLSPPVSRLMRDDDPK
jgi:hypothetical protein